jgi:methyltransferase-like protein 23
MRIDVRSNEASLYTATNRLPLDYSEVEAGGRLWKLLSVENQDALVDAVEDLEHMPYGFLLWESAIGMARFLLGMPELVSGKTVLELGCGVGLSGLIAAACGGIVKQTDHQPGVLELAKKNAEANGIFNVEQFLADWTDWKIRDPFDVVIGADILYERTMHYHLETVFRKSVKPGGMLILSDPGRPQSIELLSKMEKTGWNIQTDILPVQLQGGDAIKAQPTVQNSNGSVAARTVQVVVARCQRER